MPQAEKPSTTRRALFAAPATVVAVALPAIAAAKLSGERVEGAHEALRRRRREFIESCANAHPRGRLVATRAMAMDLDPLDCEGLQLYSRDNPERMPILTFRGHVGRRLDWIVVGPDFAYQHGPVR